MLYYLPFIILLIFCLVARHYKKRLDARSENRKERRPFESEVRLLRRPGEHLYREIEKAGDEAMLKIFVGTYFVGFALVELGSLSPHLHLTILWQAIVAAILIVAFTTLFIFGFKSLCRLREMRDRNYLGYFGECAVAERLDELKQEGYYVFHDMQCLGANCDFNIDHIVVGPTGLFAIETKTRSKYWPLEDRRREQIEFDGEQINFTWRSDTQQIGQAIGSAVWLSDQFNRKYFVQAILTFPGWKVVEREIGTAWILSAKDIATAIRRRSRRILNQQDVDEIRSYLENVCRDVEY